MAEIDTSSYPKAPAAPAEKSMMDQVQQFITIDQARLKSINDQFGLMNAELSTLANDPKTTKTEVISRLHKLANTFGMRPEIRKQMESEFIGLPDKPLGHRGSGNPELARQLKFVITRGMENQAKVNNLYGMPGTVNDGQNITPSTTSPFDNNGAPRPAGAPIQIQQPPSAIEYDNRRTLPDGSINPNFGQPVYRGPQRPQLPVGTEQVSGGFPGQYVPKPVPTQRIPGNTGTTPDWVSPNQVVADRFAPIGGSAGLPPGAGEAATNAGAASGVALAEARKRQQTFQRDIFPLAEAIPGLEKLGTKGTGPGTETFNQVKSFILSNVPGVKEEDLGFKSVKDFDKVKKYLTDFVNQTGNSGTNDKLAAAFAGNPSVGISNAAAADVAKSALALRRMRQSIDLSFEDSNLQPDQASRFFANGTIKFQGTNGKEQSIRVGQLDPRAFGVDMMTDKSKKLLLEQLNKNPREKALFEASLELAMQHGYLTPK